MLLGNWDGGMFPGQPRRQKAIVHRSHGRSPRASRLPCQGQSTAAHPGPREVARLVAKEHGAPACATPSRSLKLMGCSTLGCPSQSSPPPAHPLPHPTTSSAQNASFAISGDGRGTRWAQAGKPDPATAE